MKTFKRTFAAFLIFFSSYAFAQEKEEKRVFFVPAGEKIICLFAVKSAPDTFSFKIYRKEESQTEPALVAEFPKWTPNPNKIKEILPEEKLKELQEKFASSSPAQLAYKAKTDFGAGLAFQALVPLYPRLLTVLWKDTYLYFDENVEKGKKYIYSIASVLSDKSEKLEYTLENAVTAGETTAPATPQEVKIVEGDKAVLLVWKRGASKDFITSDAAYRIFRKKEGETEFQAIGFLTPGAEELQSFADSNLENNISYAYQVSSVSIVGIESKRTEALTATPKDKTPPAAPEKLTQKVEEEKVILTWDANKDEDLAHYNVYATENLDEFTKVNKEPVKETTFTVTDFPETKMNVLWYVVKAVDSNGNESGNSNTASVNVPDNAAPEPPLGFTAVYDEAEKKVQLKWLHSPSEETSAYVVFRGKSKEGIEKLDTITKNAVGYNDKMVASGDVFYYAVKASDSVQNYSLPTDIIEVAIPDTAPPPPPYGLRLQITEESKIELQWTGQEAEDLAGYRIYRSVDAPNDEKTWEKISEAVVKETSYVDEKAQKNVKYTYKVAAVDKSGNESKTMGEESITLTDGIAPAAPAETSAVYKKEGIYVQWAQSKEDDLEGYNMYLLDFSTGEEAKITEELVKEAHYLMKRKEITVSGNFGIAVTAVDKSGNESEKSAPVTPKEEK